MWMTNGTTEQTTSGKTTDCVWRNLKMLCKNRYANNPGMRYFIYKAAVFAIWGSCWSNTRMVSVNIQIIDIMIQKMIDMMQAACKYIPNILYNFAPYACPHNVSSAPLRPTWNKNNKKLKSFNQSITRQKHKENNESSGNQYYAGSPSAHHPALKIDTVSLM